MHTHRVNVHIKKWKEGNVLFNDALNTFHFTVIWRWAYGRGLLR